MLVPVSFVRSFSKHNTCHTMNMEVEERENLNLGLRKRTKDVQFEYDYTVKSGKINSLKVDLLN